MLEFLNFVPTLNRQVSDGNFFPVGNVVVCFNIYVSMTFEID